jgi:phosphoribosyl 1,2-cyclic phosphodiesterase
LGIARRGIVPFAIIERRSTAKSRTTSTFKGFSTLSVTVRSFGSGSSGNAVLVEAGKSSILVDCGVGPKVLKQGFSLAGSEPEDLSALLVTHEHVDHVRSVGWITKRGVQIATTDGTARAVGLARSAHTRIVDGSPTTFDGIRVLPIAVSHDAAEPCGFYLEMSDARITIVTDLGCSTEALIEPIANSDLVVLEANHDEAMLRRGPYPAHIKRRVLSSEGHLSNVHSGALLTQALSGRTTPITIWLAHLSQVNNTPTMAVNTVQRMLADHFGRVTLRAVPRHGCDLTWRSNEPFVPTTNDFQLQLPGM